MKDELRRLPSVDMVISEERIKQLQELYPHELIVEVVRQHLQYLRQTIAAGDACPSIYTIIESIQAKLSALGTPNLRSVINATGVVLHTNLGRAPLSEATVAAMEDVCKGYCNLEFDLYSGKRGSRHTHIEPILCQLTGAEAGLVVNNNASAVMLGLAALTKRKEVIVSRGQAVEIGGGFRVPDVLRQSGAKLVEVGTTNCTYASDYEEAITPRSAALLRVHSSNFKLTGFIHMVSLEEMAASGKRFCIPVLDDLGSGCLLDTVKFGLDREPMVQNSIAAGAGVVFFSGDKLLGGPQAGIIVGRKQYIDKLKKHPLVRAMRIDKIRLAGLIATLTHYLKGEATSKIPIWRMISAPVGEIESRAEVWARSLPGLARVADGESMIGGGSLPGGSLPTRLVAIVSRDRKKAQNIAQIFSQRLRSRKIPVIGRISGDTFLLDPRSVLPEEDHIVIQALRELKDTVGLYSN